jgi:5-methylcytosine-specific restriction enzyme subunit McrC
LRTETVVESKETLIKVTPSEAASLEAAGRRLASTSVWWGDDAREEGGNPAGGRTLVRCRPTAGKTYGLTVLGAVGAIAVGDLQVIVRPKIPMSHFIYLLNRSGAMPRLDASKGALATDDSFWDVVARWYLDQLEKVVRRDLIRDYREETAQLAIARGRIVPLPTGRDFYRGQLRPTCQYEDFDANNSLNRVLRAAAKAIAASTTLPPDRRRKATWLLRPFDGVEDLQPGDLSVAIERRSGWYQDALTLAKSILLGQSRSLEGGGGIAWTFLFKTADLVEEGIRQVLSAGLESHPVSKKGMKLQPSSLTLTPDLRFDADNAVGDVKYKLAGSDWNRGDLYQAVTFGTAFGTEKVAVVGFSSEPVPTIPVVHVGEVEVTPFWWRCQSEIPPEEAAGQLCENVRVWLDSIEQVDLMEHALSI